MHSESSKNHYIMIATFRPKVLLEPPKVRNGKIERSNFAEWWKGFQHSLQMVFAAERNYNYLLKNTPISTPELRLADLYLSSLELDTNMAEADKAPLRLKAISEIGKQQLKIKDIE